MFNSKRTISGHLQIRFEDPRDVQDEVRRLRGLHPHFPQLSAEGDRPRRVRRRLFVRQRGSRLQAQAR